MALNDAWGHDGLSYNGKEMRELVKSLTGGLSGVTGTSTALKVSQQTVAAATVKVAEGGAVIPATGAGLGGSYQVYNDADLTSPTIAPTSANGRKDRLILRVTAGVPALEVVQGVASGSPAEPSITGDNYLELALITLPASTTNITDAMITDRRVRLAPGTPVVATSTTRPASPFEGMVIYETDTDRVLWFDGTNWQRRGVRIDAPGVVVGAAPSVAQKREAEPWLQGGTLVATTSAGGDVALTFPTPFPNGVFSVMVCAGDAVSGFYEPQVIQSTVSLTGAQFRARNDAGVAIAATSLRFNWLAFGW